jgi:hypothetical protein
VTHLLLPELQAQTELLLATAAQLSSTKDLWLAIFNISTKQISTKQTKKCILGNN